MNTQTAKLAKNEQEDGSRVSTPTASSQINRIPSDHPADTPSQDAHADSSGLSDNDAFTASFASMLDSTLNLSHSEPTSPQAPMAPDRQHKSHLLLPLPTPSANKSQTSFALPDSRPEECLVNLDNLPPEIATADISIAPDGSFVETSSGAAARELKRRYDQYLGVGKDVRSPYVITAFVNQHGRQMYRVGTRELSAPAVATVDDTDIKPTRAKSVAVSSATNYSSHAPYPPHKRRSRMSVHSFLPPTMFKTGSTSMMYHPKPPIEDGSRSPPVRKLRKTRSIPNMPGTEQSAAPVAKAPAPIGRPHAHSVSSADAFRGPLPPPPLVPETPPKPTPQDMFSDVLTWNEVPPSPFSIRSALPSRRNTVVEDESPVDIIAHPFGPNVIFDLPSWRSASHLSSPPVLREMQSFESGLTARADPQPRPSRLGNLRVRQSDESQPSPVDQPSPMESPIEPDTPVYNPSPATEPSMLSRYSTDLFDVLQNYSGLPALDKILPLSNEATIKLSLKADETAAPRDDPRFVIWGEVEPDDPDDVSLSRASATDLSSGHSGVSRRRSSKRHTVAVADTPFVRVSSGEGPKRVLVAATIERWIAQLTSELNYDELLIFFMTYRTYVSAVDLGHLLICRFHWALGQPISAHDEMVRRIVRVRTFIAIRYWLLTFFSIDFVPNRELRLLFANWLNSLRKDPILDRHRDALSIVRKLRKVVLDCKDAHTRKGRFTGRQSTEKSKEFSLHPLGDLSNGHFAESLRRAISKEDEDEDIDLDFDSAESQDVQKFGVTTTSPSKNPTTSVDLAMLRQPLHLAFLQHGKQPMASVQPSSSGNSVPLPIAHSALSRVIVGAMGRLGRWKRVLNNRSPVRAPVGACVDVSAFDLEVNESGDLLLVRGGVEQYLKMVESQLTQGDSLTPQQSTAPPNVLPNLNTPIPPPASSIIPTTQSNVTPTSTHADTADSQPEDLPPVSESTGEQPSTNSRPVSAIPESLDIPTLANTSTTTLTSSSQADSSDSRASLDSGPNRPWRLDVVSIDDLDLSDMSSDENVNIAHGPGLRKLPRRLPNRRDFEFVRHSVDSVSSMGIQTRESVMSAGSSSVVSATSASAEDKLGDKIQQWQVNALVDSLSDEEEEGNAEAALRRLEGQISQDKQKAKQSKVDGWVKSIQDRLKNGQFGDASSRHSSDEEDYGQIQDGPSRPLSRSSVSHISSRISSRNSVSSVISPQSSEAPATDSVPAPDALHVAPQSSHGPAISSASEAKPAAEDAVPVEILQSRVPSKPSTSAGSPPTNSISRQMNGFSLALSSSRFMTDKSKWHRSFIHGYRSELLVQHFTMIDRELFLGLKFEELVSQDWVGSAKDANIHDWSEFLRERARLRAEGRGGQKTSALTAVRGRFNLMANFVQSEIVLTHPSERMAVMGKFIRMAWKAYNLRSFNLLVAIIAGLRSRHASKAVKQTYKGLGIWERRIYDDLTAFTTSSGDFKLIRQTVEALVEAKPIPGNPQDTSVISTDGQSSTARSRAASDGKPPAPPACIPFFGVYLSSLLRYGALPDLIDPTAPNESVVIDPVTNTFEAPAHPEIFSTLAPLPPSVQLEPLINVHKQRLVADVVKSLVAGQHLAAKVQYPLDKKLFQKCLKLRGLDSDTLQRALNLYSDP